MTDVRDAAVAAYKANICVLPPREDGSKAPDVRAWTAYQKTRPDDNQMKEWYGSKQEPTARTGVGFLTGAVSGGLECLEFEDGDSVIRFKELATELGLWDLVKRVEFGYCETTPGGGIHWLYRVPQPLKNTKLAEKPCTGEPECSKHQAGERHCLIETRGEGGYVVAAPSHGGVHPTGNAYRLVSGGPQNISHLTTEERDALWAIARALDEWPREAVAPATTRENRTAEGSRPGDLWAAATSWRDILEPHGWTFLARRGALEYIRRPGKSGAFASATAGIRGNDPSADYLYVFSTSTPFDAERAYNKFSAWALLNFDSDYSAAARELASRGFRDDRTVFAAELTASGGLLGSGSPTAVSVAEQNVSVTNADTAGKAGELFGNRDCSATQYHFEPIFPEGHFVADYIAYASQRTDAALEYHEAAALMLLSSVTPKMRAYLAQWPSGLPTNLYALLIGTTTRSRKSTVVSFVQDILSEVVDDAMLPDQFSPEAFVEQLAKRSGQPSVWLVDEFGEQLEAMIHKQYMKGAKGLLLTVYSGRDYTNERHSKRVKGGTTVIDSDVITDPHLVVFGATTPTILDDLSSKDIETGLIPRFAVVMPEQQPPRKRVGQLDGTVMGQRDALVERLRRIYTWAQSCQPRPEVRFTEEALDVIDAFSREVEDAGEEIAARLPAMAYKLAMLAAVGEGAVPKVMHINVEAQDAELGVRVARRWHGYALRFAEQIGGLDLQQRRFEGWVGSALRIVRQKGGKASRSEVMNSLRLKSKDLDELQATLVGRNLVSVEQEASGPGGGRPRYVWVVTR